MSKYRVKGPSRRVVNSVQYSWNIYDESWIRYLVDCIVYRDSPEESRVVYFYCDCANDRYVRLPDIHIHGDVSYDDALAYILDKLGIESEQQKVRITNG